MLLFYGPTVSDGVGRGKGGYERTEENVMHIFTFVVASGHCMAVAAGF